MKKNRTWTVKKLMGQYRLIKTIKKGRKMRFGSCPIKGLNVWTTRPVIKYYK